MAERGAGARDPGVLVLSGAWGVTGSESAFVTRSVAGALSRHGRVVVVVPGAGADRPDGLFDLHPAGAGAAARGRVLWPSADGASLPDGPPPSLVVVEADDAGALDIARRRLPKVPVVAIGDGGIERGGATDGRLAVGPFPGGSGTPPGPGAFEVDLYVPVNPLAAAHPHNGIGFVDYLLFLTDRSDRPDGPPTPAAAWATAAFPSESLLVVEGGTASVWRGRALRGVISVDTRADLWRLMAHARLTVDLAPGPLVARECVESLRFGTPVVVPAVSAGSRLAELGGGMSYRDHDGLLRCIATLGDAAARNDMGERGRSSAEERYGNAARFVGRLGAALAALGVAA